MGLWDETNRWGREITKKYLGNDKSFLAVFKNSTKIEEHSGIAERLMIDLEVEDACTNHV